MRHFIILKSMEGTR